MKYKISEIGKVVGGGTPSTKHAEYYSKNGIAWITPKDLSDYHKKYIGHGAKDISEEGLKNSSAKLLPVDSILVSSRAPIGYVAMAGTDLATSQGFKSIVPNTSKVMPEYLYYLMLKSKDKLEQIASGSTFKEISGKGMSNFTVDISELKEQKEIVQKLNPIFKKIEENDQINDNLTFQNILLSNSFFRFLSILFSFSFLLISLNIASAELSKYLAFAFEGILTMWALSLVPDISLNVDPLASLIIKGVSFFNNSYINSGEYPLLGMIDLNP